MDNISIIRAKLASIDARTQGSIEHCRNAIKGLNFILRHVTVVDDTGKGGIFAIQRSVDDIESEIDFVQDYAADELYRLHQEIGEKQRKIHELERELKRANEELEEVRFERQAKERGYIRGGEPHEHTRPTRQELKKGKCHL